MDDVDRDALCAELQSLRQEVAALHNDVRQLCQAWQKYEHLLERFNRPGLGLFMKGASNGR